MKEHKLTAERIAAYSRYLRMEERADGTLEKYLRDIRHFAVWLDGRPVTKELAVAWKEYLVVQQYAPATINGMLAALNGLLSFLGWNECGVKPLKRQRSVFRSGERELTRAEYLRLLEAARRAGRERLYLVMETLCSTGMRVSELRYITVETLERGFASVDCKGKQRTILLTKRLRRTLTEYCRRRGIRSGAVFVTRTGRSLDRSNIWREMRSLCVYAGVDASKVFPHNLRHLFAVSFYNVEKDIAKLADLLGHASIETTRIYIMESSTAHVQRLERLGLVV